MEVVATTKIVCSICKNMGKEARTQSIDICKDCHKEWVKFYEELKKKLNR